MFPQQHPIEVVPRAPCRLERLLGHERCYRRLTRYTDLLPVGGFKGGDPELICYLLHQEGHLSLLAVHQNHVLRLAVLDELQDALGVRVSREREVFHGHVYRDGSLVGFELS